MTTRGNNALRRLDLAMMRLVARLRPMNVDVFVPLYANTFPLATVAKKAYVKAGNERRIAIQEFDWNWSKDETKDPPFRSSRPHQLFFATKSEFQRIHAAGISFFAVPASVFHPRYIFLSLPSGASPADARVVALKADVEAALGSRHRSGAARRTSRRRIALTWVSDIPDQAAMISDKVETYLGAKRRGPSLVQFWRDRPLQSALGLGPGSAERKPRIKAFVWGGPLASVAKNGVNAMTGSGGQAPFGWHRDPGRASVRIDLPRLSQAFTEDKIDEKHALYCCVGYKETRLLKDYYVSEQHLGDEACSLEGRKFAALHGSEIPDLVADLRAFFVGLFAAAKEVSAAIDAGGTPAGAPGSLKLLAEFQADYDKFCRTLNPVAQLYSAEEYAQCLCNHHDADTFADLFSSRTPAAP